jgi:hypothetical protein
MGRQINYLVLTDEFSALLQAVSKPEPAVWVPELQPTPNLTLWDGSMPPPLSGWLIRERDLPRMRDQDAWWWEANNCFVFSAGGFGLEMEACYFGGRVLHRGRMYFNTLPPVDEEVSRWAGRAMAAARRFLVRQPESFIYWGPLVARWIEEGRAIPSKGGNAVEVVLAAT